MDERDLADMIMSDDPDEPINYPPRRDVGPGVHDLTFDEYLADPCVRPSLRSGDLVRMLRTTPAHVRALHPRLTASPEFVRKRTRAMDLGTIVHRLVLGKGQEFCVLNPADFTTKQGKAAKTLGGEEAKKAKADAEAKGLIVIDPKTSTRAQAIAGRLIEKLQREFGAWPFGDVEQTFVWTEETEHGVVYCRTRPDISSRELGLAVDLKSSAAGLSDEDLQRTLSYSDGEQLVQAAWQKRGVQRVWPELRGRVEHVHVFIETDPPYEPRVINASQIGLELADQRCTRATERFAYHLETNDWPSWRRAIIGPSQYLENRWMAEEEAAG